MKNFILIIYLTTLAACQSDPISTTQVLKAEEFYKRDMIVTIGEESYEGALVVPQAASYDFHVEARGDLDLFVMTSCHKEETKESAWNVSKTVRSGLFGWGKKKIDLKREVKFTYYPTPLEADGDCSLELGGFDKDGRHSWAFIDFESPRYTLHADVNCNGRAYESKGVTVCQARAGLVQKIDFAVPVMVGSNDCGVEGEGKSFEFTMPKGKCAVVFGHKESKSFQKLTLLGYEKILIRN